MFLCAENWKEYPVVTYTKCTVHNMMQIKNKPQVASS